MAARNTQDASLRLYLCVLLSRQPRITLGTVNSLGGDRYFSAYLTEFGTEVQVLLEDAGVLLAAEWNPGAEVLTLTHGSLTKSVGSTLGRKHQATDGGRGRGIKEQGPGSDLGGAIPSLEEWVGSLPPVRNAHELQPVTLPLHVRQFDDVPLLVTSIMVAGEPPRLVAQLFLPEVARAAKARKVEAKEVAVEAGAGVRQSLVPWDSMLQD